MTGMSVFRDEKAVKSSPKSEKNLKTQRNWRLSRTFLLSLHFESSAPACRWHSVIGVREESPGSIGHPTSETRSYW